MKYKIGDQVPVDSRFEGGYDRPIPIYGTIVGVRFPSQKNAVYKVQKQDGMVIDLSDRQIEQNQI